MFPRPSPLFRPFLSRPTYGIRTSRSGAPTQHAQSLGAAALPLGEVPAPPTDHGDPLAAFPPLGASVAAPMPAPTHCSDPTLGAPRPASAPLAPPQPGPATFASIAKGERRPRFPPIDIPKRNRTTRNGVPAVLFTRAELQQGHQQMETTVIAKFSAGKPKADEIRAFIQKTWQLKGPFTTGSLDARHELIVLDSREDLVSALACPIHQVGRYLFRLFRWTPQFSINEESSRRSVWVRIPGLAHCLMNEGYLRPIGEEIGTYLMTDVRTIEKTCPSYARMLIDVDLKKALPSRIFIGDNEGEGMELDVIYEGRLAYCSKCRLQGHDLSECRKARHQAAPATDPESHNPGPPRRPHARPRGGLTPALAPGSRRDQIWKAFQGISDFMDQPPNDPDVPIDPQQELPPNAPPAPHAPSPAPPLDREISQPDHPDNRAWTPASRRARGSFRSTGTRIGPPREVPAEATSMAPPSINHPMT